MKLSEIQKVLEAEVLCGKDLLHRDVRSCFASDLISEMLLYVNINALVITSLTNIHIAHTAEVMDAVAVVFVGNRIPDAAVVMNGAMSNIPLFTTKYLMFECCGRLFAKGLKGGQKTTDGSHVSR